MTNTTITTADITPAVFAAFIQGAPVSYADRGLLNLLDKHYVDACLSREGMGRGHVNSLVFGFAY